MEPNSECNHTSDERTKSMIPDLIGRHDVLIDIIINITLSEDLRKDKQLLKGVNCFKILFKNLVFET